MLQTNTNMIKRITMIAGLTLGLFLVSANRVPAQDEKIPASAKLGLQSGIQAGANGRNRIPLSRTDPAFTDEKLDINPAIYLTVTFTDGTSSGPIDYQQYYASNVYFDDTSGDPSDLIVINYWNVDQKDPERGKFAAQLTSTGKGVGTAYLKVSFRNAPGVTAQVAVEVVSAAPKSTGAKTILPGGVPMIFVQLAGGEFQMGAISERIGNQSGFMPVHQVKLTKGFMMQVSEVTQAQWKSVMGSLPTCESEKLFVGDNKPVACTSWDDAQLFIAKVNAANDGFKYRLPTEAEWEYAARAGTTGDLIPNKDAVAWYETNSGNTTHDFGTKQANAWGLYDMHGNVLEWVSDLFNEDYYKSLPEVDPKGAATGDARVYRGSYFGANGDQVNFVNGDSKVPTMRDNGVGFRLVKTAN